MGKLPWFKMFSSSWLTDPRLSRCSSSTRGIWIDLICSMHEDGQVGVLKGTAEELSRVARCSPQEFILAMTEISTKGVGDISPCPPYVPHASLEFTVTNRRMSRENLKKVFERNKKKNQRVKSKKTDCPVNVPSMSPNMSPSMSPEFPGERLEVRGKRLDNNPPVTLTSDIPQGEVLVERMVNERSTNVEPEPLPEDLFIDEIPEEVFQLDPPPEKKKIGAPGFDKFWAAYPKKVSKGHAEKAWSRIRPTQKLVDEMLEAIAAAKKSKDWKKNNGEFIPNPATWLNGKRWQDEISLENSVAKPGDPRGKWWGNRVLKKDEKLIEEVNGGK